MIAYEIKMWDAYGQYWDSLYFKLISTNVDELYKEFCSRFGPPHDKHQVIIDGFDDNFQKNILRTKIFYTKENTFALFRISYKSLWKFRTIYDEFEVSRDS